MNKILICLVLILSFFLTGCSNQEKVEENPKREEKSEMKEESDVMTSIGVIINGQNYVLHLEENETVERFLEHLPQEFSMTELNGNEKYIYMDFSLPTNSSNPGEIHRGDVMLYGDNCLVVFYESFHTSYSYTKIGTISNLPDLGKGDITIKFEK